MLVVHDNDGWHGDVMRVVSSAMTAGGGQSYTLGGGATRNVTEYMIIWYYH